jgi:hypothetical protein
LQWFDASVVCLYVATLVDMAVFLCYNSVMGAVYKQYTEDDKATALAMYTAKGGPDVEGSLTATALALGIPDSTLSEWVAGRHVSRAVTEKSDVYAQELAARLDVVAAKIVGAMADDAKINGARYGELSTALKTSIETGRLIREKATPDAETLSRAMIPANAIREALREARDRKAAESE